MPGLSSLSDGSEPGRAGSVYPAKDVQEFTLQQPDTPPIEHSIPTAPPQSHVVPSHGIFFGSEGLRAGWGITLFFLLFGFCTAAQVGLMKKVGALPLAGSHVIPLRTTLWNDLPAGSFVLLLTLLLAKVEHRPFSTYGLGGAHWLRQLLAGLAWGILSLSLLVFLLTRAGLLRFEGRILTSSAAVRYGAAWAGCFLLVGLFEETFLRGYLQVTLARGLAALYGTITSARHRDALGFWTAALLLSLLFGAIHRGNPGESPIGLVSAALAGLVFCLSLWRTGALWWAIGFHASWDWAQSFLYGVADSGTVAAGRLFGSHPIGRPILSGGLTGPEGSVLVLPVLALVAAVIMLTLRQGLQPSASQTLNTASDPS